MSTCEHCGAPLARAPGAVAVCRFCEQPNSPLPAKVEVPVPVQVVHQVVHVTGEASAGVRCPHCRRTLVAVQASDVELSGCGGCGGIWVGNDSARRVLAEPKTIFGELAARAASNARHRGRRTERPLCAECPAWLERVRTHGIDLDVCSAHGTWFDARELTHLVQALTSGVPAREFRPGDTREVKCAGCKRVLTADRANISDTGLICDSCWQERQAEIIEAGDRKARADGIAAVAGVLFGVASVMLGGSGNSG